MRALGKLEARVAERGPHPLARLPHGRVREADDRERRQAAADVDLHQDIPGLDPDAGRTCGPMRARRPKPRSGRERGWRARGAGSVTLLPQSRAQRGRAAAPSFGRMTWSASTRPARRGLRGRPAGGRGMDGCSSATRGPRGVRGELDIVARQGRELVFVEVKARSTRRRDRTADSPVLAVGHPQAGPGFAAWPRAWLRERGRAQSASPACASTSPGCGSARRPGRRLRVPPRRLLTPGLAVQRELAVGDRGERAAMQVGRARRA